jgi:hypothetical protein
VRSVHLAPRFTSTDILGALLLASQIFTRQAAGWGQLAKMASCCTEEPAFSGSKSWWEHKPQARRRKWPQHSEHEWVVSEKVAMKSGPDWIGEPAAD